MTATTPEAILATVEEAAAALRVSPDTVHALITDGSLPHVRVRTLVRVRWDDIHALATPRSTP